MALSTMFIKDSSITAHTITVIRKFAKNNMMKAKESVNFTPYLCLLMINFNLT